jgi:galacturan 1,4-alpha-galacturonidase
MKNITLTSFELLGGRSEPFSISQCTSYSGATNVSCDTSKFKISDITLSDVTGSTDSKYVAVMQCSAAAGGCDDINLVDIAVRDSGNSSYGDANLYQCSNFYETVGFNCTGGVGTNPGGS